MDRYRDVQKNYFEGCYFKFQDQKESLALIPAFHADRFGNSSASLQVITDDRSFSIGYKAEALSADFAHLSICLGNSAFSERGCDIHAETPDCMLRGRVRFGTLHPPAYDMMGPFRFVPFMECRHKVFSFRHRVDGEISVGRRKFVFQNGGGYLEGDRGRSFPKRYLWTQCIEGNDSLMMSVAEISYLGLSFTGCTGFLFRNGKETRIATYCGAKLLAVQNDAIVVRQKDLTLQIRRLGGQDQTLRAPQLGDMVRTVQESISCTVRYTCTVGRKILFDFVSGQASFEGCWNSSGPDYGVI